VSRGANKPVGSERWSQNGYHYTKTKEGWQLTNRMLLAEKLGRPLEKHERAIFVNGNKRDLRPENIELATIKTNTDSLRKREAELEAKLEEIQGMLDSVREQIHENNVSQVV
jgi:hypothetical protein